MNHKWALRDQITSKYLGNRTCVSPGYLDTKWTHDMEAAKLFYIEERDEIAVRVKRLNRERKLEWVKIGYSYEVWEIGTQAIDL